MTAFQPQYRLTLYAPRSVDPTESTVLIPRAGATHADPFRIASAQGLAGWRPYLDGFRGRHSAIDPLEKRTDTGQLTARVLDAKVGSNAQRWVVAFLGDGTGSTQLIGRRCVVEESLDAGVTWTLFFTGRVGNAKLDGKMFFELEIREAIDDLDQDVFVGQPAASASYAFMAPVAPVGLLKPYGDFPMTTPLKGVVARQASGGTLSFMIETTPTDGDLSRTLVTQPLADLDAYGIGTDGHSAYGRGLVMISTDGGATYAPYDFDHASVGASTSLTMIQVRPLQGSTTRPALGTTVRFYVLSLIAKPSTATPVYVNDIHPMTFLNDLAAGKFGRLDASGNPTWSVNIGASVTALEADPSFPKMRFRITERVRLNEFLEAEIFRPLNLAYFFDATGALQVVDLRRSATVAPVTTLTSGDIDADDGSVGWTQGRDEALTSVMTYYYAERFVSAADLPKPFTPLTPGMAPKWPDVAAGRVEDAGEPYALRLEDLGLRALDLPHTEYEIDAHGLRFRVGQGGGAETIDGTMVGKPRATAIVEHLTGVASELRAPFALGAMYVDLTCRRASSAVAAALQGSYVVLDVDVLPDPATGARGGQRLALVVERSEDGPRVRLRCLDAGANAVAVGPSLSAFVVGSDTVRQATVAVALNAAGDAVRVEYAQTATSVSVSPTTGWSVAGLVTSAQTLTLQVPNGGRRLWVRARTEPASGQSFKLPSGWVTPSNAAYVDLASVPAPSSLVATGTENAIGLTWVDGDPTLPVDVYLKAGSAPSAWSETYRTATLIPGSTQFLWYQVSPGVAYTVGVAHRDADGRSSTVVTGTATPTTATLTEPTDPTPWAGTHDLLTGLDVADGTYGIGVAASVLPGDVEIQEAVETAPGSGVFSAFASVGRVPAIQGDWTRWGSLAPNDGRARQLAARSVRGTSDVGGFSASPWTDAVTVTPWTPTELPAFQRTVGGTTLSDFTYTETDTTRTWTWSRGARVAYVWVFDRLEALPVVADPWPNPTDLPDAILRAGVDTYTLAKPGIGFQRFLYLLPWYRESGIYKRGEVVKLTIDPATPAGAPIARGRAFLTATRDAEDVYVLVESIHAEPMTLRVRDGDGPTATVWTLCQGASDATTRYVASGTEVGPSDYFTNGSGVQSQFLAAIALKRDQIRRLYVQATGQVSGVSGSWSPIALSLLEQPYLESIAATWDEASGNLRVRVKGGPHCASVFIEADDNGAFSSPVTATAALADGGEYIATFALTGANRGKTWFARATPYNQAALGGLSGVSIVDEAAVPALVDVDVVVTSNVSLSVVVSDPGSFVDVAQRVKFYVRTGNGPRALQSPTTAPTAGVTTGTYTLTLTLDQKHDTVVEPVVYLVDGSQITPGGETFDADVIAEILNATVAYAGSVATVSAVCDTDTATGAANLEYSLTGGAPWTGLTVTASRLVQFALAMSSSAKQTVTLRAKNAAGTPGPTLTVEISRYDAATTGPTLNVVATPASLTYSITYTYSATSISYYVDGVLTTLPSSPITVSRPAAGSAPKQITFVASGGGQTITESITVPAIDADTVSPDVQLIASAPGTTQQVYTAFATNPKTLGNLNATFTFQGCSGTVAGNAVAAGGSFTALANGITIVANRPSVGSPPGSIRMTSTVSGGGSSEISRTVSEQTKDFTLPVFEPYLATTASIYTGYFSVPSGCWVYGKTDTGSWGILYDGISNFNTAYMVSRNAAGGSAKTMYLKAVHQTTGLETQKTFEVPPQESTSSPTPPAVVYGMGITPNYSTSAVDVTWSVSNFPSGGYMYLYWRHSYTGNQGSIYVGTSGTASVPNSSHGITFTFGGGAYTYFECAVEVYNSSGVLVERSGWQQSSRIETTSSMI